jgi:L-threonylcarbamoyladenylate synthase
VPLLLKLQMPADYKESLEAIKSGKVILCPTDTIWGISCDATNAEAVKKIFDIKNRPGNASLIVLVHDLDMLGRYIDDFPDFAVDLLGYATTPLTIIFPKGVKLAQSVTAIDGSVAIRVVNTDTEEGRFCSGLIRKMNKPLVSTSANISGKPAPAKFQDIDPEIKDKVDFIVPYFHANFNERKPSRIIKLNDDGTFKIIR